MTTAPFQSRRSAVSLLAERMSRPGRPLSAMIEIADRCNEVCVHCYQVQGQKGEMTTEQVYDVLAQLAKLGVLFLTISGGEATLRSDFLDIVKRARELGFAVKLYTNGLTMTPELADSMYEHAVQEVQISLYSHRADVHDWVTRVPGSWAKSTNAVRLLRARRVRTVIKTPMMSVNASRADRDGYIALAHELDADWSMDPGVIDGREDGDRSSEALTASAASIRDAYDDERLMHKRRGAADRKPDDASVCGACRGAVHVEANGEIRPCASLTTSLGNALTDGIEAAFVQGESSRLLRSLTWADLHGCRDCGLRDYCGRCFANGLRESGDALGPYERACRAARSHYEQMNDVETSVSAEGMRDPNVGPYAFESPTQLVCIEDVLTDRDHELARTGPFRKGAPLPAPAPVLPGDLVQIRRPGKKPRVEQVPSATPSAAPTEPAE